MTARVGNDNKLRFCVVFMLAYGGGVVAILFGLGAVQPGATRLFESVAYVLLFPMLLVLMAIDFDGDLLPRWFQMATPFVNGLFWALVALWVRYEVKRSREE